MYRLSFLLLALLFLFSYESPRAGNKSDPAKLKPFNIDKTVHSITLSNVHVVDIENRKIIENQDIIIEGSLIKEVRPHKPNQVFRTDTIIQGNGSYVIPSICDMHHHMTPSDFDFSGNTPERQIEILEDQLQYGIQAIMNPNISLDATNFILDENRVGASPYLILTGPSIGPNKGWGGHQVSSKEEISNIIEQLHTMGIQVVKFTYDDLSWLGGQMPVLEPELLKYIIETSHGKGMKAIAHVADLSRAKELLRMGLDGLVHGIVSEKVDEEFLSLLKENRAFYIPTTAVYETSFGFQESVRKQFEYNIWEEFPEEFRDSLSNDASRDMWNSWWPKANSLKHGLSNIYWNTKAVYESGNLVMMGSDTGTPGVLPGISAYYELELMENSGLTPYEVLECATVAPLKYLGLYPKQGKIAKGSKANMIVLKKDPTSSVNNINTSWLVLYNGALVSNSRDLVGTH